MRTVATIQAELASATARVSDLSNELHGIREATHDALLRLTGQTQIVNSLIDNAARVREFLAPFDGTLTDDQADAAERVFAHLECPACHGSGHIHDAEEVAAQITDDRLDAAVRAWCGWAPGSGIVSSVQRAGMRRAITALYASKDVTIDE